MSAVSWPADLSRARVDDLKQALSRWRPRLVAAPWRLAATAGLFKGEGTAVQFVVENADWVIPWMGERLRTEIESVSPDLFSTTTRPQRLVNRVAHFGSQYMWTAWGPHLSRTNRCVVSFFHGKREDGADVSRHIDEFLASVPRLSRIITGAGLIESRLLDWGVPRSKLVRIPIGIDTALFRPPTPAERELARAKLAIPTGAIVVGSFQKDGVGWGEGRVPKLIKGPDVLLKAVERLNRDAPLVVLLAGPARGFVKHGLERLGVRYVHLYAKSQAELVECYHALDLYLVTSREEGGPMGLLESMASGVPVVSTRVGMAPDFIVDGVTGGLAAPEDVEGLAERALGLLALSPDVAATLKQKAVQSVKICDWSAVARRHLDEVYLPLVRDAI